ncbi:TetR family transcriptional regulator [Paenibacillus sp. MMS20-IR301]|uniref:TetR/AcrR family transcriptional regulator n=1 Tax=Paenibacillus sp. MMS20-IR301 TaxID=2895946 RepID=UPI0028E3B3CC|nr:TetR family transcriptional regulator [Paenibacillus sp. MMS20-IR301]WNS46394.1 TetR family transcriptional regulator [Paenibacillus sp. MMS20-IR301]
MNLREKQMQLTRQIIKDTALGLFCSQGIERTDLSQIAQTAGVSRRTLYHHYKDKEDLAAQLYVENLEQMFGQLLFDFDFGQPLQSLENILDKYLALREHQESLIYYDAIFGVYCSTLSRNPAELPDFKRAMEVWYTRFVRMETTVSAAPEEVNHWLDILQKSTHLYFMYLQKAVIITHQRGGLVTEEDRAADRQFKDFIISGVRSSCDHKAR